MNDVFLKCAAPHLNSLFFFQLTIDLTVLLFYEKSLTLNMSGRFRGIHNGILLPPLFNVTEMPDFTPIHKIGFSVF